MKKFMALILVIICLFVLASCKNETNSPPPLDTLIEYSEEQLNELLVGYSMSDIRAAWGTPETPKNITLHCDIYPIQNSDKLLFIFYDGNMKIKSVIFRSPVIN